MKDTVQVPVALLRKMSRAGQAFQDLEEELEDFLISQDPRLLSSLEKAREQHRAGNVRPFSRVQSHK